MPSSEARNSTLEVLLSSEIFAFLNSGRLPKRRIEFRKKQTLFCQGEAAKNIFYIQAGRIRVAITSAAGKDAVVAILGPGDFLGEACLAGQQLRIATATTMTPGSVLAIEKDDMLRLLHAEHDFSDRFIFYMVIRNLRTEEDLIDQLFNSSEKRLARALLLLARYGKPDQALTLPKVSQKVLAEMIGTTRTRVELFLEQVQEARVHRRRRRPEDQQVTSRRGPARLTNDRSEELDTMPSTDSMEGLPPSSYAQDALGSSVAN
jgi:CRP/FNR family cyclic AMP-dependent transcriptional regulator